MVKALNFMDLSPEQEQQEHIDQNVEIKTLSVVSNDQKLVKKM